MAVALFDFTDGLFFARIFAASCFFSPIFLLVVTAGTDVTAVVSVVVTTVAGYVLAVCSDTTPECVVLVASEPVASDTGEIAFLSLVLGEVLAVGVFFVMLLGVSRSLVPPRDTLVEFGVPPFSDLGVFS